MAQLGKESACNAGDLSSVLGWEDPVEKIATHSSTLAESMIEEPGTVHGVTRVGLFATKSYHLQWELLSHIIFLKYMIISISENQDSKSGL